jgi:thiol-disulfide isomerase/thioredoxin
MMSAFEVSYVFLWLLLLVMGILVLLLYRHFGLISMGTLEGVQRDGVPVGEQVPPVFGTSAEGESVTWRPGPEPALLIFASPECEPCEAVLPHVRRLAMTVPRQALQVVAVTEGREDAAGRLREKFQLPVPCLAEGGGGAFSSYRVRVTPFGFVIGEDGRVRAKGLCNDATRLRDLLSTAGMSTVAGMVMVDDLKADVRRSVHEPGYDRVEREEKGVTT